MSADDHESSFHSLVPEITMGMDSVASPSMSAEELEHYYSPSQYPLDNTDGLLSADPLPFSSTGRRNSTGELEHQALNARRTSTTGLEDLQNARLLTNSLSHLPLDIGAPLSTGSVPIVHNSSADKAVAASSCSSIYFSVHDDSSSTFSSSSNLPITEQELVFAPLKVSERCPLSPKVMQRTSQPPFPAYCQPGPPLVSSNSETTTLLYPERNGQSSPRVIRMNQFKCSEVLNGNSRIIYDDIHASVEKATDNNDAHIASILNSDFHDKPSRYFQPNSLTTERIHREQSSCIGSTDDEADWPEPEEQYASLPSSRSSMENGMVAGLNSRRSLKPPMDADYFRDHPRGEPMGSESELAAPSVNANVNNRLKFVKPSVNKRLVKKSEECNSCSSGSDSDNATSMSYVAPVRSSVLRSSWLRDCIEGADSVEEQQQTGLGTTNVLVMPLSSQRYLSTSDTYLTTECGVIVDNEGNVRPPLVGQSEDGSAANAQFSLQVSVISMEDSAEVHPNDEEMPSKTSISTSSTSKDSLALRVSSLLKSTIQNISGAKSISEDLRAGKTRLVPGPTEGQVQEKDVSRQQCGCPARESGHKENNDDRMRRLSSETGILIEVGHERAEQNLDYKSEVEVGEHSIDAKYQVRNASDRRLDSLLQNSALVQQRDHVREQSSGQSANIIDDSKGGLQPESASMEHPTGKTDYTPEQRTSSPSVMSVSSVASSKRLEWDSGADVGYGGPKVMYGLSTLERMAIGSCCSAIKRMEPEGKSSLVKDNPVNQTTSLVTIPAPQPTGTSTDVTAKFSNGLEPDDAANSSDLDCDSDIVNMTYVIDCESGRPVSGELMPERPDSSEGSSNAVSGDELAEKISLVEQYRNELERRDTFEMIEVTSPENGEVASGKPPHKRIASLGSKSFRSCSLTDLTDTALPKQSNCDLPVRKIQHSSSISDILESKRTVGQHVGKWGSLSSTGSFLSSHSSKTVIGLPLSAEAKVAPTPNPFCSTAIHDSGSSYLRQKLSFHTPSNVVSCDVTIPKTDNSSFVPSEPSSQSHQQSCKSRSLSKIASPPLQSVQEASDLQLSKTEAGKLGRHFTKKKLETECTSPRVKHKLNSIISKLEEPAVCSKSQNNKSCMDDRHRDYLVSFTKDFVAKLCPASDVQRQQRLLNKILGDFGISLSKGSKGENQSASFAIDELHRPELQNMISSSSNVDTTTEITTRHLPTEKGYTFPSEKTSKPVEALENFKILQPQPAAINPVASIDLTNEKPQDIAILKPYSPGNSNVVFYAPVNVEDLGSILVGRLGNNQVIRQTSALHLQTVVDAENQNAADDPLLKHSSLMDSSSNRDGVANSQGTANEKSSSSVEKNIKQKQCKEVFGKAKSDSSSCYLIAHNNRQTPGFLSSGSMISNSTLLDRLPANGGSATTLESSKERPTDIGAALYAAHSLELREGGKAPQDEAPSTKSSFDKHVSSVGSLVDSSQGMSRRLWPDSQRFREKAIPRLSSRPYTNSTESTVNESSSQHRQSSYAYHSVQQRISYTSESSSKDTMDRSHKHLNCYSSSRRFIQRLRTVDSIHPEGLGLVKELIRQQRKSYIKKLQKEVLWLERIEAILHGTEVNYNSITHEYDESRSSCVGNVPRSPNHHASPKRTRNKKSQYNSESSVQYAKPTKAISDCSSGPAIRKRKINTAPLKNSTVQQTKDFGQSFPTPVPTDIEINHHVIDAEQQRPVSVGVQTSFKSSEEPPDLGSKDKGRLGVIGKERPVISIPLAISKKVRKPDVFPGQKAAVHSSKSNNKSHLGFSQKLSPGSKTNITKHKKKPVAWFLPWDDDDASEIVILQTVNGGGRKSATNGSRVESFSADHFPSLQETFKLKKSNIIDKLKSRQQKIQLAAERRKNTSSVNRFNINAHSFKGRPRKYTVPLPISSQHHNPQSRHLTHTEMREQTEKVYQSLPEVADKKEIKKREDVYRTNRLMAQMFKKKLQQKVLKGQVSMQNTKKCL